MVMVMITTKTTTVTTTKTETITKKKKDTKYRLIKLITGISFCQILLLEYFICFVLVLLTAHLKMISGLCSAGFLYIRSCFHHKKQVRGVNVYRVSSDSFH